MKKVYILYDYRKCFGSKYDSVPYRSGLDKDLLAKEFKRVGYDVINKPISDISQISIDLNAFYIYTSSEDNKEYYKQFIEDAVFYLENVGANVIPRFELLKAHNNKVFMELLRYKYGYLWKDNLKSLVYGSREEVLNNINQIVFPVVVKKAAGAMSRGVFLAHNENELRLHLKKVSKTNRFFSFWNFKEILRQKIHIGYKRESKYRSKFILQPYIVNLKNDWKILLYGDILFVLSRGVKKNDFRASGSHHKYFAGSKAVVPEGLFDFAYKIKTGLKVPHLSLDVVYDGKSFHLVEFQAVYFGTSTINMSDVYYKKDGAKWHPVKIDMSLEELYVYGIHHYLVNN